MFFVLSLVTTITNDIYQQFWGWIQLWLLFFCPTVSVSSWLDKVILRSVATSIHLDDPGVLGKVCNEHWDRCKVCSEQRGRAKYAMNSEVGLNCATSSEEGIKYAMSIEAGLNVCNEQWGRAKCVWWAVRQGWTCPVRSEAGLNVYDEQWGRAERVQWEVRQG